MRFPVLCSLLLCLSHLPAAANSGSDITIKQGLAHTCPGDQGLENNEHVLFFDNFETDTSVFNTSGRAVIQKSSPLAGTKVLVSHNKQSKHLPWDTHTAVKAVDTVYYRFYSCFEEDYDFGGGVKGPGVSAKKAGTGQPGGGAGIKPKGDDKFGARICFDKSGQPYIYYYHMDMGRWGSNAKQTIGEPVHMKPGQWYCLEMMLKSNDPAAKNGELALWVDGQLKLHKKDIRFRTTDKLKVNWINHSAYFGGSWTSPKDQSRFEDNIVAATHYIGPCGTTTNDQIKTNEPASH